MTAPVADVGDAGFPTPLEIHGVITIVGLSFYTGAMGLDLGLERGAEVRFLLAADCFAAARATIRANRPQIRVLDDASRLTAAQVRKAAGLSPDDVIDVVAGCPPCPPWSVAGKRRGVNDPRGMLLPGYFDLAIALEPRLITHENVKGLASAELGGEKGGLLKLLVYELRRNGYRVAWEVLNAANFGAPQDRERLILIACLDADPVMPEPTHSKDGSGGLPQWRTLRDAVDGLPPNPCDHLDYSPKMLRYMSRLQPGQWWKHLPPELQREAVPYMERWGGGGTGTLRRLSWDRPCPTVTCSPGQKMTTLGHPDEDRPLSVQECMRAQGFPDDWQLRGSVSDRYVQAGNAVPPPLSTAVGRAIAKALGITQCEHAAAERPIEVTTPPTHLSGDVSKKGDGVLAWLIRLPGDRCPFATPTCSRLCYAKHGFFPKHADLHDENYAFAKSDRFVEDMAGEIRRAAGMADGQILSVCLHGKGEFFSLPYLRRWREIIERTSDCGGLRYYAYTHAWTQQDYHSELDAIAKDFPNVRINLSADRDNSREHGVPERIGDGLVTWLAETDSDLPPVGAPVDLVFRSTLQRNLPPAETLGGFRVCPNEAHLFWSRRGGKPVMQDGKPLRITCGECRLCIDRSAAEWDKVKNGFRSGGPDGGGASDEAPSSTHGRFVPAGSPGEANVARPCAFKFIDLCSGIGGFRLAIEAAGGQCVFSSEIDRCAREVYHANFGELPSGDITKIQAEDVPDHDLLCAGFPCQPFSLSGKRLGFEDATRGTIVFDIVRIAKAKRPAAILLENVKGLMSHDNGRTLATIVGALEEIGYRVTTPKVLNASLYGCPTTRERVFIVAIRSDLSATSFRFPEPTNEPVCLADKLLPDSETDRWVVSGRNVFIDTDAVTRAAGKVALEPVRVGLVDDRNAQGYRIYGAFGHAITLCAHGGGIGAKTGLYWINDRVRRLDPRECLRVMGYPDSFVIPPSVKPEQVRTLTGNSVVVPLVRRVYESILAALSGAGFTPGGGTPKPAPVSTTIGDGSALSLFSGCGGMDLGFEKAGFDVVGACQWDLKRPAIAKTYVANHPDAVMVDADITLPETRDRICAIFKDRRCDVIIGGPPCGPYSTSGERDPNDPKARLFEPYLDIIDRVRPKVIATENVESLLSMRNPQGGLVIDEIVAGFKRLGYEVDYKVLNSADHGVAQRRSRLIIIATRLGVPIRFPKPTHAAIPCPADNLLPWVTVSDAIGDLKDMPENAKSGHVFTRHKRETVERFSKTPVGKKGCCAKYHEGYYRNPPDAPCVTLKTVAWPLHFAHDRELTALEAARLQSFPDSFRFIGPKTHIATMIGNAVPPLLAQAVAGSVRAMLDEARTRHAPQIVCVGAPSGRPVPTIAGTPVIARPEAVLRSPSAPANRADNSAASLFSGCGGMDLGFEQAGFEVVGACQWDPEHPKIAETYALNHPGTQLVASDIALPETKDRLCALFSDRPCDVIIGGPPCVASSMAGRRDPADPRGWLFWHQIDIVDKLRPSVAVLEQVPGALSCRPGEQISVIDHIEAGLAGIGYRVEVRVLNSADFGVPQARKRVIVVASRLGVAIRFPAPTHAKDGTTARGVLPWVSVRHALQDLEDAPESDDLRHVFVRSSPEFLERIRRTLPGRSASLGYREPFRRLWADRPSPTVKGNNGGLPLHYSKDRIITPREMARLQDIPDTFRFLGTKGEMLLMVGNAVPVGLARAVAGSVRAMLDEARAGHGRQIAPVGAGNGGSVAAMAAAPVIARSVSVLRPPSAPIKGDDYSVVSLFSGCGGMDHGFEQAGFRIAAANELCTEAVPTHRLNFRATAMVAGDITDPEVKSRIVEACGGRCDVIIAGPPCGPFSRSGKRDPNDPRARLFLHELEIVERLRPYLVVTENVQPMLSARNPTGGLVIDELRDGFRRLGYEVSDKVVMAADFGVPQLRKRLFIVASRLGSPIRFPAPTHAEQPVPPSGLLPWATMRDAIGDLEQAPEDRESSHVFTRHSAAVAARFANTPIGGKGTFKDENGVAKYNEGSYKNPPDEPSVTIKTGAWPIHYAHARTLTCREAARVQSFPDSFTFVGDRSSVATMIGNAVPPLMARAMALCIRETLDEAAGRKQASRAVDSVSLDLQSAMVSHRSLEDEDLRAMTVSARIAPLFAGQSIRGHASQMTVLKAGGRVGVSAADLPLVGLN